ncbi:MAG: MBL fold metallo-hydrolase [Bacteroidales bacterium]
MTVHRIRYKSTSCYFLVVSSGILAFDAGWPGTFGAYRDAMKQEGLRPADIRWLLVSHFHMDHAGLAGLLVERGVEFAVFPNQLPFIGAMERLISGKEAGYTPIDPNRTTRLELSGSRSWLADRGISGEVIPTDGHGADHVSLVLDSGEAFIGDLAPLSSIGPEDEASRKNWQTLRTMGARQIYPAHAEPFLLN